MHASSPTPPLDFWPDVKGEKNRRLKIAGGGLSGLALGVLLTKRGCPVEIHEAGTYPRHKVCGEFLSGLRPEDLAALDIRLPGEPLYHKTSIWYRGDQIITRITLPEPALAVSRHWLDAELARKFVEQGGELHTKSRVQPSGDAWVLAVGRPPVEGGWTGVKAHFHDLALEDDLEMHMGRGGYVGLTAVENGRVNVSALVRPELIVGGNKPALLSDVMQRLGLRRLAERLRAAEVHEDSITGVTRFEPGWAAVPSMLLPVGDALAAIPPFTGHGMTMAIEGAVEAVPFLERYVSGEWPWEQARLATLDHLHRHFRVRMAWALGLHGWLTNPWKQSLLAMVARGGFLPFRFLYAKLRS